MDRTLYIPLISIILRECNSVGSILMDVTFPAEWRDLIIIWQKPKPLESFFLYKFVIKRTSDCS